MFLHKLFRPESAEGNNQCVYLGRSWEQPFEQGFRNGLKPLFGRKVGEELLGAVARIPRIPDFLGCFLRFEPNGATHAHWFVVALR
jgi:hypothetical protein